MSAPARSGDVSVAPQTSRAPGAWTRPLESAAAWWSLAALAALLRLPRLDRSFWFDEVYYSTLFRFPSWRGLIESLDVSPGAPLYRILLHAWVSLFGESEIAARLPSLLFGVGTVLLACALARRRLGDGAALGVGLWLSFSPVHVWYSQEATPYAMALCLALAAVWQGERITEGPPGPARDVVLYAGLLLATAMTHYLFAALVLSSALVAIAAPPSHRRRLWMAQAAAGACVALYLLAKIQNGHFLTSQGFLRPFTLFEAWMLGFQWFLHGNCLWTFSPYRASPGDLPAHPALLLLQLAACALLLLGTWRSLRASAGRRDPAPLAHLAILPLVFVAFGTIGYRQLYVERYALLGLPFFAFLLWRGVEPPGRRRLRHLAAIGLLATSALAYSRWLSTPSSWTVYKPNPDWRSTAADLLAPAGPPRPALVLVVTPGAALEFYLRRQAGASAPRVVPFAQFDLEREVRAGIRTIDLVRNVVWPGADAQALRALEAQPLLRRSQRFARSNVEVIRFEVRRPDSMRRPAARTRPGRTGSGEGP